MDEFKVFIIWMVMLVVASFILIYFLMKEEYDRKRFHELRERKNMRNRFK